MTVLPDELQDFLKAVTGETRQRILFLFMDGQERTVSQVAQEIRIGQSTASEQLAVLRRSGLLNLRREGKEAYYYPDRNKVLTLLDQVRDLICYCCPE